MHTTDWLMVVITAIYVIATIVISVFNGQSAHAAKRQTEEMIRQNNEANRPFVVVRFEIIRSGLLCFIVENIGRTAATNVRIEINDEFVDNIEKLDKQLRLREATSASLFLAPNQRIHILLGGQANYKEISEVVAKFNVTYSDKYSEYTEIDLKQYRFMLSYKSELEDIAQHIKRIGNETKTYHNKQLKVLSNNSPVSVLVHSDDDSDKSKVYKTVCMNAGATTEKLAEITGINKEETLEILLELDYVDQLVKGIPNEGDDYKAFWYRR